MSHKKLFCVLQQRKFDVAEGIKGLGRNLDDILDCEPDAGLGNGSYAAGHF